MLWLVLLQSSNHATSGLSQQISKFIICKCYHDFLLKPLIFVQKSKYTFYMCAQTIKELMNFITKFNNLDAVFILMTS